jgi:hypothetical protein
MSEKHDRINMPGQVDYIIENGIKTRKIARRNTLSPGVKNNQEGWQKLLRNLGIKKESTLGVDVRLTCDFPFTPTEEELKEIIDEWESSHDSRWDDVGFTFACEQSPRWHSMRAQGARTASGLRAIPTAPSPRSLQVCSAVVLEL